MALFSQLFRDAFHDAYLSAALRHWSAGTGRQLSDEYAPAIEGRTLGHAEAVQICDKLIEEVIEKLKQTVKEERG